MSFLNYQQEIKSPGEFKDEVPKLEVSPDEMKLAKTLMDALAVRDFDFGQYHDKYVENLTKLIEAKAAGQEVVAPAAEEQPQVINLMEALQKSIDAAKQAREATGAAAGKPPKQVAPSRAVAAAAGAQKKRKTS
jgi:DNA end-binding protein Ku